jgi:flavocytochrome c
METSVDVCVIGSGLAGLVAAIAAAKEGSKVLLLEKEAKFGGNSSKATSGINGCGTRLQKDRGIPDSSQMFANDIIESGRGSCDSQLVDTLVRNASEAIEFLESLGCHFDALHQCGGHSLPRTHGFAPKPDGSPVPVGWTIIQACLRYCASTYPERITLKPNCRVTSLVPSENEEDGISGCCFTENWKDADKDSKKENKAKAVVWTCHAPCVILCTGGYAFSGQEGADHQFLAKYAPHLQAMPTTNGSCAVGDGLALASAFGAGLRDMDAIQVHPTSFVDPKAPLHPVKFLAPESLRALGGLLLNSHGHRFTNELARRDVLTASIRGQEQEIGNTNANANATSPVYLLLSSATAAQFGAETLGYYQGRGLLRGCPSLAAVSEAIGLSAESSAVQDTLHAYMKAAQQDGRDDFGKVFLPLAESYLPPANTTTHGCGSGWFLAQITPAIHYTMGGCRCNGLGEVLGDNAAAFSQTPPIAGLFCAGEVAGGMHGSNRLAGNSLLECVVMGQISGRRAAQSALLSVSSAPPLQQGVWTPLMLIEKQDLGNGKEKKKPLSQLFRFALPSSRQHLGWGVGEYLAVRAPLLPGGGWIERFYSPVSRPEAAGYVDLVLKVSNDDKSQYMAAAGVAPSMAVHVSRMRPGVDSLEFTGPMGGLDLSPSLSSTPSGMHLVLMAGGTGIAPMLQIIRSFMHAKRWDVEITLVYGAVIEEELIFRDVLEQQSKEHPSMKVHWVLQTPPLSWTGHTGFINEKLMRELLPPPSDMVFVVLCGPPAMCKALKPVITNLGYPKWYSFM